MAERTLVFDGDCAFCTSTARWLQRRVPTPAVVRPWQRTDLGPLRLTPEQCEQAVQWVEWVDGERRHSSGALAFAHYLQTARDPWRRAGRVLASAPAQRLARPVYAWIARNRHRLPGGTPACRLDD